MNKNPEDRRKRVEGSRYEIVKSSYHNDSVVAYFITDGGYNKLAEGYFPTYNAAKQYLLDTGLIENSYDKSLTHEYRIKQLNSINFHGEFLTMVRFFYDKGTTKLLNLDKDMAILIINKLTEEYLNK